VPCVVRDDLAGDDALVVMVSENDAAKRHGLPPLAEAGVFGQLAERGWSQRRIAERMGCRQPHVSKRLALLRLPDAAIEALAGGQITAADGAELGRLAAHPDRAVKALEEIGGTGWATAERVVTRHLAQIEQEQSAAAVRDKMEAEGLTVVDPGTLGSFAYAKRLDDVVAAAPHRDPDSHAGPAAELPAWSSSYGPGRAARDAERAEQDRQRAAAARVRKEAAGRLAVRPVSMARAAELVSLALIARHVDAQCLETAVKWLRAAWGRPGRGRSLRLRRAGHRERGPPRDPAPGRRDGLGR
jgi:predicted transcriptional regulator